MSNVEKAVGVLSADLKMKFCVYCGKQMNEDDSCCPTCNAVAHDNYVKRACLVCTRCGGGYMLDVDLAREQFTPCPECGSRSTELFFADDETEMIKGFAEAYVDATQWDDYVGPGSQSNGEYVNADGKEYRKVICGTPGGAVW